MANNKLGTISHLPSKLFIIAYIGFGIVLGILTLLSHYAAAAATLAIPLILVVYRSSLNVILIFIILIPFSQTSLFTTNMMGLPGAKPILILGAFIIVIGLINYTKSENISKFGYIFLAGFLIIFTLSFIRAIPQLDTINSMRIEGLSPFRFFLSDFVKPLVYILPLIIIIKFSVDLKDIGFVLNAMALSLVALSAYILFAQLFKISDPSDIYAVDEFFTLNLGMHRNDIANFYIIGFPFVLSKYFLKKSIPNLLILGLTIAAVGFIYSRTAYIILLFAFLLYLIISNRTKFLPIVLAIAFALSFILASSILERASKGLGSRDLDNIFSGRIESLWLPLIKEYSENPIDIILGNGRYAIFSTAVSKKGIILGASHPHNMYLEQILDAGLIGLCTFMMLIAVLLKKILNSFRNTALHRLKEYQYASFVAIISYLIAGITGRTLFPVLPNAFLWITIALALVILAFSDQIGDSKIFKK